jgi:hypothetical protein
VREVWIFGSYVRGALEVGDVDLALEFDQTKDEAGQWFAIRLAGGFDHLGALSRELRGNQRVLEIHFNELDDLRKEGFEPRLLWRRGDSLEKGRARLAALAADASARRAARDTVHPLLADVEKLIPRPARQEFSLFMWAGWLEAKLVELPPQQAANAVTCRRFAEQWGEAKSLLPGSARRRQLPRTRGGCAAERGRNALLGRAGDSRFRAGLLAAARRRPLWCQVARVGDVRLRPGNTARARRLEPTARKQTLRALDMRASVDREEFFQFQHGDGRLRLIERLAAAYRAGELPEYMLEFVDSLRTRATPATS